MSSLPIGGGLALLNESLEGEFDSSAAGEQLLWLVARGSSVIAELQRLSEHIPSAFTDSPISPHDKFLPLISDFTYFKKPDVLDARAAQMYELDDECKDVHSSLLARFYQLFETIVRYAADLAYFSQQLNDGVFVQFTVDNILMDNGGKQLMTEAFFLYGVMIMLLEFKIPGLVRERMIVSYFRYNGRSAIQSIEDVIKVCRNSGGSPVNLTKRPNKYPEEMFARFRLPTNIIRMIIGKLRTDDIYNYLAAYPNPDHRSFAFSTQATMLYVLLYFTPDILQNENAIMREIVDKYFGDNWIITLFMGISVDLNVWWEPYKAARAALKNINQPNIVKGLSDRFYKQFADLKPIIKEYLLEGVLNEDFILLKLPVILGHVRDGNTILKWLLLHRTTSNKKTKELVMSNVSDDSVLEFLLDLSQFEYQLKRILESVLSKRKDSWDRCLTEALDRIEELSDYFSGDKPLTKVKKDENLQKWFKDMAEKVRALAYENALVSGRKMQTIATAIENLEQFHQIEANIHIKKFLIDIRDYLNRMIRIVNVKPATMGQLSVICDFAYGWEIVQSQSYKGIMQRKVRENPRLCLFFRATFLKMVSIMEVPLVRIQQCGSDDSISVAAYYSSKLVAFIRSILQILPQSMFDTLNRIVQIQTQNIKDLPMKIELNDLHIHAKLEERYNLAKATHEVSLFTEGILEMKTTFVGIISVDPRDLLEQGIRKELVRQLSSALNDILSFKTDKVGEFEGCLRALAQKMIGFQRSFEYIQDYVNLYGLKVLQEELYRIINFYLEQESNLFLKKKIQPFESIYQSEAIPIPEFTPKDKFSITFLGRLVRQLALLTDPKKSVYISDRQGWFGIDGKEVVGIKTFDLLSNSLGVFGLNGIDRLVSFMIVQDMNKITSTFERTILKSAENMSFYDELSKELFPFSRNLDNPEKVYNSAMSKLEKIHSINDMIDWISSIGQKQLIRMQIQNELFFSCKIDSKLLFSSLEAFNNGLLMDIKSHYRNPDKTPYPNPETNPLLSEVNNYLEAGGMTSPLGKIYITCDPLYNFPTYLCILTLWEIPKLYWSASLGLTHKSRKDGKLDGAVFIIGLCTVLKQFHPSYTETYVALLSQYAKNIIQSNSEKILSQKELNQNILDVILFLREFVRLGSISRDIVDSNLPPYLFDNLLK